MGIYLVYIPENHRIILSTDIIFQEKLSDCGNNKPALLKDFVHEEKDDDRPESNNNLFEDSYDKIVVENEH